MLIKCQSEMLGKQLDMKFQVQEEDGNLEVLVYRGK